MDSYIDHFLAGVRREVETHGRLSHYFAQVENHEAACLFTFPRSDEALRRVIPRLARIHAARRGILGEVVFSPNGSARLRVIEFSATKLVERSAPILRIDGGFFVGSLAQPREIPLTPSTAEIYLALHG